MEELRGHPKEEQGQLDGERGPLEEYKRSQERSGDKKFPKRRWTWGQFGMLVG